MSQQNYKNHSRLIPLYHFITFGAVLAVLIMAIIIMIKALGGGGTQLAVMLLLMALILCSFFVFSRMFALKAQDRAIRAEENFRHYLLTGKPFDSRLTMGQIIALRFASDAEMPALAQKAVAEGLSSGDIKKAIQNWRADNHRA